MLTAQPHPEGDEVDRINKILDQVRGILSEHFEVGVLMLSKQNDEGFTSYHGTQFGNKFAVSGMVEAYVSGEFDDPVVEVEFDDGEE
jgi:hypothetical protein